MELDDKVLPRNNIADSFGKNKYRRAVITMEGVLVLCWNVRHVNNGVCV